MLLSLREKKKLYRLIKLYYSLKRFRNVARTKHSAFNVSKPSIFTIQRNYKVMVSGASGAIGQPLSLLLKLNPLVTRLALYDIVRVPGVEADLSHIDTKTVVSGHQGLEQMCSAVKDADVIVCTGGSPRKPGMTRDDLFSINATVVYQLAECMAKNAPNAALAIITNPVNAAVPIAAQVLYKAGVFNPCKVFGVTTLDLVRASTFIGAINCIDPAYVRVPIIGGHAGTTIIPVLSQSQPPVNLTEKSDIEALTKKIQEAGTVVVKAKAGAGSASLSTAYAAARFTDSILRGFSGQVGIIECAYVRSDVSPVRYFANPLLFGRNGIEMNLGFGCLNSFENDLFCKAIPQLEKSIKKGEQWTPKSPKEGKSKGKN